MRVAHRLSEPARMRYAGDVFHTGSGRLRDRVVSSSYFALSTPLWGNLSTDASHLAAFQAALDELAARGARPSFIVDVGTGAGASAALLAERWPAATVEAIDSSWRMLQRAKRMHSRPNLRFRRASALAMPYPAGSVDLVTCLNAIVVPREMRRVCTPGGHVLAAATWVSLRDDDSDWVRAFADQGLRRVAAGSHGNGSWELFQTAIEASS
jgi:ubiquinone/menaquinone biosynthesis C-methylase UbiE